MVEAVLRIGPSGAAVPQPGFACPCIGAIVLVQLDSAAGPVIRVPIEVRGVTLLRATGAMFEVDVQYLPLRIGWATTVTSTQGLEFSKVLLDLNRARWLRGGGYSGVGRVKGDMRSGLRILGGFNGDRDVFWCDEAVRKWYMERVLPKV